MELKVSRRSLLALAAASFTARRAPAQSQADIDKITKLLEAGAKRFRESIADVTPQQWDARLSGIRHTIGEEAEHAALSENDIQTKVKEALQRPAMVVEAKSLAGKEEMLHDLLLGEGKTAENFKPLGKLVNKDEVFEYYSAANRKLMTLLQDADGLDSHVSIHPVEKIGPLTAMQWFYYIAYHRENHIRQIEAIKSNPAYPGGQRVAD